MCGSRSSCQLIPVSEYGLPNLDSCSSLDLLGRYAYLNVAFSANTSFTVHVNGVQSDTSYWSSCAFNSLGPLLAGPLTNITIHINGDPALSDRDLDTTHGNNWSLGDVMYILQAFFWWQLTNISFSFLLGLRKN